MLRISIEGNLPHGRNKSDGENETRITYVNLML